MEGRKQTAFHDVGLQEKIDDDGASRAHTAAQQNRRPVPGVGDFPQG